MNIDPNTYGLPSRTKLEKLADGSIAILMERKSRIIMADGKKLLEKVQQIKEVDQSLSVVIKVKAQVCSKTRIFLEEKGVRVIDW